MSFVNRDEAAALCGVSRRVFMGRIEHLARPVRISERIVRFRRDDVLIARELFVLVPAALRRQPRFSLHQRVRGGTWFARFSVRGRRFERSTRTKDHDAALIIAGGYVYRAACSLTAEGPGVYVLRSGGFIKVGRAVGQISARMRALQTAQPEPLELIAILSDDPDEEHRFQRAMAPFRARGEWFHLTPESARQLRVLAHGGHS